MQHTSTYNEIPPEALALFPSLHTDTRYKATTEKYRVIPTMPIIEEMRKNNFGVYSIVEAHTKLADRKPYVRHLLRFRARDWQAREVGDVVPEIVMLNSHDGSSGWNLYGGLFRLICTNGLVVGSNFDAYRVPHIGNNVAHKVLDAVSKLQSNFGAVLNRVEAMRARRLSADETLQFAQRAAAIRYPNEPNASIGWITAPRRLEDDGASLWQVFNVAQEGLIRGGHTRINSHGRSGRVRGLTALNKQVSVNRQLFDLAESYLA
jgi:hypothetical protein